MLLFCPRCGTQHIDAPETKPDDQDDRVPVTTWTNPPHRSHLCHACGIVWRPADVATVGVAAIETRGKADTWTPNTPWSGHNRPAATSANETGAEEAKLDKPAKVGATRFGVGVKWSTVIGAAQRLYEYDVTPEKEAARIDRARTVLEDIRNGKYTSAPAMAAAAPADERAPLERTWHEARNAWLAAQRHGTQEEADAAAIAVLARAAASPMHAVYEELRAWQDAAGFLTPEEFVNARSSASPAAGALGSIALQLERMLLSAECYVGADQTVTGYRIKTGALHEILGILAGAGHPVEVPANMPIAPQPAQADAPAEAREPSLTNEQIAATARQHATSFVDGDDAITDLFFEGTSYLEFARDLLAPTQQPSGEVPGGRTYPDEMSPALRDVLGRPNFWCGPIAHEMRAAGAEIKAKTEDEQAHVLHWLVKLVLDHGDDWQKHAETDLRAIREKADAARAQGGDNANG
ncbi:hypothetical protein WK77_05970 [Burkholderia ubonensis]|nr:hypothetical protein WK77_05970 [Burkholderia ubonensis]